MIKRVEEITKKINDLDRQYHFDKEIIMEEWQYIRNQCAHPELGETFMFMCPDCDYYGGPTYPQHLTHMEYVNYPKKLEKERAYRRSLKTKFTREEIKDKVRKVEETLLILGKKLKNDTASLNEEWEKIKLDCKHLSLANGYCYDCGWYSSTELLF